MRDMRTYEDMGSGVGLNKDTGLKGNFVGDIFKKQLCHRKNQQEQLYIE